MRLVWLIIGVAVVYGLFLAVDQWFYRRAVRRYHFLSPEEKRQTGIYGPLTISIFSSLGRRPAEHELGIRWREHLHMGPGGAIPCYSLIPEFD
jgi:hypothetical protein